MKSKTSYKKNKKEGNSSRKRNIELTILYLKLLKYFKLVLAISIIISVFSFIFLLYKNNTVQKIGNEISFLYSKYAYKNTCVNIEINGINRAEVRLAEEKVHSFCDLDNKGDLNILLSDLNHDPWIKNITIKRRIPNNLQINIEEYVPFAIWKNGEKIHLIDEYGEIINVSDREKKVYYNLLIVAGDGSKENIYSLFNMLSSNPYLFSRIKSALRIGKRRWNFELDNGILVKMPEDYVLEAWNKLDNLIKTKGAEINLQSIDLRNRDKIFLEEQE